MASCLSESDDSKCNCASQCEDVGAASAAACIRSSRWNEGTKQSKAGNHGQDAVGEEAEPHPLDPHGALFSIPARSASELAWCLLSQELSIGVMRVEEVCEYT